MRKKYEIILCIKFEIMRHYKQDDIKYKLIDIQQTDSR